MMGDIVHEGKILFLTEELRCKGSGQILLAPGFQEALVRLRVSYNDPMPLTSACRSTTYNKAVGGAPNSYHIYDTGRGCCAVDVRTYNSQNRAKLVHLALAQGWSVGIHKSFTHLDLRSKYEPFAPQVLFLYGS